MKERPILYAAPMVRAVLADAKTQTRRIVRDQERVEPADDENTPLFVHSRTCPGYCDYACGGVEVAPDGKVASSDYGAPGDRLWVREAFAYSVKDPDAFNEAHSPETHDIVCRATSDGTGSWTTYDDTGKASPTRPRWRPGIHMPRWASRLDLAVAEVRVQRLQAITEADARAEGALHGPTECTTAREAFSVLWVDINGSKSWDANPWVWAVTFRRLP